MKKLSLLIITMILVAALSAHPASSVSISYDARNSQITVDFEHSVKSASDHYIQTLTLKINNKTIISQVYSLQEKSAGGLAIYRIPGLRKGDVIEVITDCNKGGKKSGKLTLN
ncbi:MAG: hypothetical protein KBA79_01480 [Candidatus Cloacimonetes bacterium]|jgi:hypothetical protein|nr:hypothetical protein [Candidatus Cloacimonadota bacterium]HOH79494.1 hypothetical protein [Candidatus Cloacimonadota bacterium]